MRRALCILTLGLITSPVSLPAPPPEVNHQPSDAFFSKLQALCGQAFEGKLTVDTPDSGTFADQRLVMHVRECSDSVIRIPFHVGENRSRTWVVEKTLNGLSLKHDHRHQDGSSDALTQYGGIATTRGWDTVQSFPADAFTKALFVRQQIPESNDNTWQLYVFDSTFTYRLIRPAREVRVDFDLTAPIEAPPPPWGASPDEDQSQ